MNVLILTEEYCDANPAAGPTNAESMVVGAIRSSGLPVNLKHFYYDQLALREGRARMAALLLQDVAVFRPDAIIYTPMGGLLGLQVNPPDDTILRIMSIGIPVYQHLWDTIGREDEIRRVNLPFCNLAGDVASDASRFKDPKMIQVWSAIDSREFYDRGMKRDIDVCFVGSVDPTGQRWPQRWRMIEYLRKQGVPVHVRGGQRTDRLEWGEYAETLARSKISLNFSKDPNTNTSQLKGRVFESMACGAMLLEDDGEETKKWFEPGKEWVMFSSPDDMVAKAIYYLRHPAERQAIADAGRKRLEAQYGAGVMWKMVLDRLFEIRMEYLTRKAIDLSGHAPEHRGKE